MCFAQGVVWTLILSGWRHWNRSAKFSGQSVGAKIRRWWWGVNNWKIPDAKSKLKDTKLAKNVSEVSAAFLEVWHPGASKPTGHQLHTDRMNSTTRPSSRALHKTRRDLYMHSTAFRNTATEYHRFFIAYISTLTSLTLTPCYCARLAAVPHGRAFLHCCPAPLSFSAGRASFPRVCANT